jgi:hypothetical protein
VDSLEVVPAKRKDGAGASIVIDVDLMDLMEDYGDIGAS